MSVIILCLLLLLIIGITIYFVFFYHWLPNNIIEKPDENFKPKHIDKDKILLAIRSYNRPEYLAKTLKSINNSDAVNNANIIIYDDGSDNVETIKILENTKYPVIVGNKNVGCYQSYLDLLDHIKDNYQDVEYILILDNDVEVKQDFIKQITYVYQNAMYQFDTTNILLSGFNSSAHHHNNQQSKKLQHFTVKYSTGAVCYMFHKDMLNTIRKGWEKQEDWGISKIIKKQKYYFTVMNNGVVNHIGKIGLHFNGKKHIEHDPNF